MEQNEQYSIIPEVQAIYNEVVKENGELSAEEIDNMVEEIYYQNKRKDMPKTKKNNEDEVLEEDIPEPTVEEETIQIQEQVDFLEERMARLEEGQEKIVSVLEVLSDKIDRKSEEPTTVEELKNEVEEESKTENDLETEEAEEVESEPEAEPAEEKSEEEPAEEKVEEEVVENEAIWHPKEETPAEEKVEESEPEEEPVVVEEETKGLKKLFKKNEAEEETIHLEEQEEVAEPAEEEKVEETEEATEEVSEVESSEEEAVEEAAEPEEEATEEPVNNNKEETMTDEQINELVARIKNELADEAVKAPEVEEVKAEEKEDNSISKNFRVRYNQQVAAAWDAYRLKSAAGMEKLAKINEYNFNELVKAGRINNDVVDGPITIDGTPGIGGFILPPEIDKMIHGKRTDYSALLDQIDYTETTSLQFAYATRVGDINMRPVKMCEAGGTITDDANHVRPDNLKPIEGYNLTQGLAQMEEFAAVTPICNAVTRFAAADILADVAAGYRADYDRKLAQLFVIRLQQAINTTDNKVEFDPASATDALVDFLKATTKVSEGVVNGKFLFNAKTKAALLEYIFKAGSGDMQTAAFTNGDTPTIFGYPYIVVPNDLLPTLGEGDVKTFVAQSLDGTTIETVDITSPVFYGDFSEYRGKVHGGLAYDISADASYEVYGASGVIEVRSAWQRNELVIRGSMFRGGYIADPTVIAGMEPVASS